MRPQDLLNMPPPVPDPGPPDPSVLRRQSRAERMQHIQGLIDNFTFSLGSGLTASAEARGGARNKTYAGVGAALQAPAYLEKARQDLALRKAQEDRQYALNAQTAAATETANAQRQAQLDAILAGTKLREAQTATEVEKPLLTNAQMEAVQAGTEKTKVETQRAKYISTPQGLMDTSTPTPTMVPGSGPNDRIEVTSELAAKYGLPKEIVGEHLRTSDINNLVNAGKPTRRQFARLADGVYLVDPETGAKERVGDLPPTGQSTAPTRIVDNLGNFQGWAFPDGRFTPAPIEGGRTTTQSQTTMTRNELFQDIINKLDVLEAAAKNHPAAVGGPLGIGGKLGSLATSLGLSNDPEVADIYSLSADLSDQRLRARSGAQINEQEMKRITRFSPNATAQTSAQFFNNLQNMRNEVGAMLKTQTTARPVTPRGATAPEVRPGASIPDFIRVNGRAVPNPAKQ